MSFSYNPVDTDAVGEVKIVEARSESHGESSGRTREQERKRQLINLLDKEFDHFSSTFTRLMQIWHHPDESGARNDVMRFLGIPEYRVCANCSKLTDWGECWKYVNEDGDHVKIDDVNTKPKWCDVDDFKFCFPPDLVDEVDCPGELPDVYDYKNFIQNSEWGDESHKPTFDNWLAKEVDRRLCSVANSVGADKGYYRSYALRAAWFLHLRPTINEGYHRQRAEAYLREMGHQFQQRTQVGSGGVEFEDGVREMFRQCGFSLYPRRFEFADASGRYKEMDIHTEIGDVPLIVEVYTSRVDSEKEKQLTNYGELYKKATGEQPILLRLTDYSRDYFVSQRLKRAMAGFGAHRVPELYQLIAPTTDRGDFVDVTIGKDSRGLFFRRSRSGGRGGRQWHRTSMSDVVSPAATQSCLTPKLFLDLLTRL